MSSPLACRVLARPRHTRCNTPAAHAESGNSLVVAGLASDNHSMLFGREAELQRFAVFLEWVRSGGGVALVITGDAGTGKTALLHRLMTMAGELGGFTILQARCLESESEIPYAGLADVTRPLRDLTGR